MILMGVCMVGLYNGARWCSVVILTIALVWCVPTGSQAQDGVVVADAVDSPETPVLRDVTVEPVRTRTLQRQPRRDPKPVDALPPREERRRQARLKASVKHLESLDPAFRVKVEAMLEALRVEGWEPVVISGRRTVQQQQRIVNAGNSRTMKSYHLCGRAVDVADARYGWRGEARTPRPAVEDGMDCAEIGRVADDLHV